MSHLLVEIDVVYVFFDQNEHSVFLVQTLDDSPDNFGVCQERLFVIKLVSVHLELAGPVDDIFERDGSVIPCLMFAHLVADLGREFLVGALVQLDLPCLWLHHLLGSVGIAHLLVSILS